MSSKQLAQKAFRTHSLQKHFRFNDNIYIQKQGTTMGTKMEFSTDEVTFHLIELLLLTDLDSFFLRVSVLSSVQT